MISAKLAAPGILKIKQFWNQVHDIILSFNDVMNRILFRESSYIGNLVMWSKFGSLTISLTKDIITSMLWKFDLKKQLFWGVPLVLVLALKFYTSLVKRLKIKVRKICNLLISTFVGVTWEKLVRGGGTHADFKNLPKRTVSDKTLLGKAVAIASNPKYRVLLLWLIPWRS